jgi:alpha-mannosidase
MLSEFSCVLANNLSNGSFSYPADTIKHGWWLTLAQQFHDVVTGTSIPTVYSNYAIPAEDSAYGWFNYALGLAVNTIANNASGQFLNTTVSEAGRIPLVLVNPLSVSRTDVVETSVNFGTAAPAGVKVYDPAGNEVPAQIDSAVGQNVAIVFVASVPATSYSVYEVKPMTAANPADPSLAVSAAATGSTISNDYYTVSVNATGDISSVVAKKLPGTPNLLSAPSRYELRTDVGTSFPAWELRYQDIMAAPTGVVDQQVAMSVFENGPARVSLKVTRSKNNSIYTHIISLASGAAGARLDIDNTVYWQTTGTLLKVSFPMSFANPKATWDLGIGTIQRGNILAQGADTLYEVPGHEWADMTSPDGTYGLSILNNCKYGWGKPNNNTLNLTLIHSPSPAGNYQGDQSSIPIVGNHRFKYSYYAHTGDWTTGTIAQGQQLNQPIYVVQTQPAAGAFGKVISLVRTDTSQVNIMAIKKAEKSSNYVVRVRETMGKPIQNTKLTFPANAITSAVELNGAEDTLQGTQFSVSGNALTFSLNKYQPRAFSVKLGPPVAINQKFSDLMQPKPSDVTLTVVLASCKSMRTEIKVPYGVRIRTLSITDALGRIVRKLAEEQSATHASTIVWDGKDLNSQRVRAGVYFVRCVSDQGHWTGRLSVTQ